VSDPFAEAMGSAKPRFVREYRKINGGLCYPP
jgi:hypothetical protein